MGFQLALIVFGVVMFGGMFFGLLIAYRDIESKRSGVSPAQRATEALGVPTFYGWRDADAAGTDEVMLRQIEHHLRREALMAEQFIKNPTPQTLRAGEHVGLGAN